jgi:DNA-binding MarR family transcriptional regulator
MHVMKNDAPILLNELGQCAHANLRRTMRAVGRHYDQALKPSGLKATQFTLLAVLANKREMPVTQLAEVMGMDRTTLTRNLGPLQRGGWIENGREEDERVRLISLSEAGFEKVEQAVPMWRAAQARVVDTLGASGVAELSDVLAALSLSAEQ